VDYAQLGKTDLVVSRVCFGCWQLSPRFWGQIDLDDWRAALRKSVDVGVNFIDTADAYGEGYAETSLGDWFAADGLRDSFVLATKFYHNFENPDERVPDTSYDYIIRECEASLKRLRTDRIDLYQIHAWDPLTRPDEVAAAFTKLKKDGKIRWFGVSNMNADQMRMYLRYWPVECLQPLYNLLDRDAEAHEFPLCLEKRIGVITYSSLARGLLTGKYTPETTFEDHRGNNPRFKGEKFQKIIDAVNSLQPFADKYGITIPQLAIRWVLTHPAVTSAIVGVKKPEHIEGIAPAANGLLDARDWWKMANVIAAAK
jgi:aryl-alcohol dehydrogenase-like predicted oxidoreductase